MLLSPLHSGGVTPYLGSTVLSPWRSILWSFESCWRAWVPSYPLQPCLPLSGLHSPHPGFTPHPPSGCQQRPRGSPSLPLSLAHLGRWRFPSLVPRSGESLSMPSHPEAPSSSLLLTQSSSNSSASLDLPRSPLVSCHGSSRTPEKRAAVCLPCWSLLLAVGDPCWGCAPHGCLLMHTWGLLVQGRHPGAPRPASHMHRSLAQLWSEYLMVCCWPESPQTFASLAW